MQTHFQPLHSPKTKAFKWFKSNFIHFYLLVCLELFILYLGFHVQNLFLNHVQKAVFWKKSPHTVQVYKEEIPLFSLAFLALLACVTLWEWLCKPYTLKKKGKQKAKTQKSFQPSLNFPPLWSQENHSCLFLFKWCSWKTEAINMSQA